MILICLFLFFFFKQKTAYELRISDWSSDVCSSDLRVLVNVGPAKAEAIVAYRKKNGAFKSAEQLAMVKGIGLKTVEKNRDRLSFGGERKAKPVGKAGAGANVGAASRGGIGRHRLRPGGRGPAVGRRRLGWNGHDAIQGGLTPRPDRTGGGGGVLDQK